jgi:hypothetical protein
MKKTADLSKEQMEELIRSLSLDIMDAEVGLALIQKAMLERKKKDVIEEYPDFIPLLEITLKLSKCVLDNDLVDYGYGHLEKGL